jgi:hypothetical protein
MDKTLSLLRTLVDERRSYGSLGLLMRMAKRISFELNEGREV